MRLLVAAAATLLPACSLGAFDFQTTVDGIDFNIDADRSLNLDIFEEGPFDGANFSPLPIDIVPANGGTTLERPITNDAPVSYNGDFVSYYVRITDDLSDNLTGRNDYALQVNIPDGLGEFVGIIGLGSTLTQTVDAFGTPAVYTPLTTSSPFFFGLDSSSNNTDTVSVSRNGTDGGGAVTVGGTMLEGDGQPALISGRGQDSFRLIFSTGLTPFGVVPEPTTAFTWLGLAAAGFCASRRRHEG